MKWPGYLSSIEDGWEREGGSWGMHGDNWEVVINVLWRSRRTLSLCKQEGRHVMRDKSPCHHPSARSLDHFKH